MKFLYSIILLISTNLLFAQDTLKNDFPSYFISTIELRYELIELKTKKEIPSQYIYHPSFYLDQTIKPFSPDELPPYFDLELSEEDIFDFQSGFEIEPIAYFKEAENKFINQPRSNHYSNTFLIYTTNFDSKESANFYNLLIDQKDLSFKNYLSFSNIIYQRESFLRSFIEWNLKKRNTGLHVNIAYTNNQFYRHLDLPSLGYGDRSFVYFPKKYHEKRNGEWGHLIETQNLYLSEINAFTKILFSPIKKTYVKVDYEIRYFINSNISQTQQRFYTLGFGIKPKEGTILFLEYTNRTIIFDRSPLLFLTTQEPYFALNAKQILNFRIFNK